jgi:hypothetical protein
VNKEKMIEVAGPGPDDAYGLPSSSAFPNVGGSAPLGDATVFQEAFDVTTNFRGGGG